MSSRTAALAFTHRSVWCRPPTGSPRSGDYRCGSVSSAPTSGPCARWPWRRLKHTRRVEAAAKKPFLWAAPWTRELFSPFSIFTATVSKLLPLPMAQIDASITFPKAPWPKTFPVPGGETEERRIYFCPIRLEASSHVGIQRICMEEEDSEIQPRLLRSKHVLFLFSKAVLGIRKREKNSVDVAQPSAIKNSGCGDLIHFQPSILLRVPCFLPPSLISPSSLCVCAHQVGAGPWRPPTARSRRAGIHTAHPEAPRPGPWWWTDSLSWCPPGWPEIPSWEEVREAPARTWANEEGGEKKRKFKKRLEIRGFLC